MGSTEQPDGFKVKVHIAGRQVVAARTGSGRPLSEASWGSARSGRGRGRVEK